jgi:hypothetical protein
MARRSLAARVETEGARAGMARKEEGIKTVTRITKIEKVILK